MTAATLNEAYPTMTRRSCTGGAVVAGLVTLLSIAFAATAAADATAAAQPQASSAQVRSLRNLGGPSRFTAPVRDLAALRRSMARPGIQRDLGTVLDRAGLGPLTPQVRAVLAEGRVTEATLAQGAFSGRD